MKTKDNGKSLFKVRCFGHLMTTVPR